MITINYGGGLGNRMFMYAAAYVLSKKHKILIKTNLSEYPHEEILDVKNYEFNNEIVVTNKNFMSIYESDEIKSNLLLNDYFQTSEIVTKFQYEFKECFNLNLNPINGTIIHYRLGDLLIFYNSEAVTKLNYFEKCIDCIENKKNMYITTDSPHHENVQYLVDKYNIKLIDIKRADTIKFASRFTNKILSTGTFSWWIGFLGNQKSNVYCPIPDEYYKWLGDIYIFKEWNYVSYKF